MGFCCEQISVMDNELHVPRRNDNGAGIEDDNEVFYDIDNVDEQSDDEPEFQDVQDHVNGLQDFDCDCMLEEMFWFLRSLFYGGLFSRSSKVPTSYLISVMDNELHVPRRNDNGAGIEDDNEVFYDIDNVDEQSDDEPEFQDVQDHVNGLQDFDCDCMLEEMFWFLRSLFYGGLFFAIFEGANIVFDQRAAVYIVYGVEVDVNYSDLPKADHTRQDEESNFLPKRVGVHIETLIENFPHMKDTLLILNDDIVDDVQKHLKIQDPICNLVNICQSADMSIADAVNMWLKLEVSEVFADKLNSRKEMAFNVYALTARMKNKGKRHQSGSSENEVDENENRPEKRRMK
nr:unnamed protein product [Callosobruchus analis]